MGQNNYKPEFCDIVIKEMAEGVSVDAIGCKLISENKPHGVVRSTVYKWMEDFPEFKEAIDTGNQLHQSSLEKNINLKASGGKNCKNIDFNSSAFLLRTKFHKTYSEKTHSIVDSSETYEQYLKNKQLENKESNGEEKSE